MKRNKKIELLAPAGNLKKLKIAFAKAPKKVVSETNIAIKKSIFTIERESKPVTPVLTGRLKASIGGGSFQGGSYPEGEGIEFRSLYGAIGPTTDYAIYVHRRKPFMELGVKASMSDINRFFQRAADNVVKFIAKKTNV